MSVAIPGLSLVTGGLGFFSGIYGMSRNGFSMGGMMNTAMSGVGILMGGAGLTMMAAASAATAAGAAASAAAVSMATALAAGNTLAASAAASTLAASSATAAASAATASSMWASMIAFGSNPITLAIVVTVIVIAILLAVFGAKPSEAEQGLIEGVQQLSIWHPGYAFLIPATAGLLTLIPALNSPKAPTQPIVVSSQLLRNQLAQDAYGINRASISAGQVPYGMPLLMLDANGNVSRVAIVTRFGVDAQGRARDQIKVYDLNKKYIFASPKDPTKYIPLMVGNTFNPDALKSLETQRSLLSACLSGAITPAQCTTAITLAASMSKDVEAIPIN